jgi:gluconate 2-dehydrogenase gamma chain
MPPAVPSSPASVLLTRREAIQRAALFLGVALSPSLLAGALQAQSGAAGATRGPRYLSAAQFAIAAAVAERILPRTDTPGAGDVGVPAFIDLMFGAYLTPEENALLAAGLAEVEQLSTQQYRRGFTQLTPAQQDELLGGLARASESKEKTFFHLIREVTVLGYFTSEPVGKNVLHYDPIPGRYEGCVPLSEVGNRAWTR